MDSPSAAVQQILAWLERNGVEPATAPSFLTDGSLDGAANRADVDRVAALLGESDSRIAKLLEAAWRIDAELPAEPPGWLLTEELPMAVRGVVGLSVTGQLHARRMYEESLGWLAWVEAETSLAPHLIHYYRAVAQHQLVRLAEAEASADALLALPGTQRRHRDLAELIRRDATGVEPESIDHLARSMNDINRRLDLGRSAEPEQGLQQQVLDALDKMIEEAEKQQQQQQQQAQAGGQSAPSRPMDESRPAEMKGPGEVDPRDVAKGGDWGSLPPDERDRVTQQIGRDFPSYYRDLIEAYFRSLAKQGEGDPAERRPAETRH